MHWFGNWSQMQKEDFLKDLVEKASPNMDTLFDAMGVLEMNDKPPSIFKCQMKLFSEWFLTWTDSERRDFLLRLQQLDPLFVSRFEERSSAARN